MTDRVINHIEKLGEDYFTQSILKPIFEAKNYKWVDFNGGPNEFGADLIAVKDDDLTGDYELVCIQSKKIKSSKKEIGQDSKLYKLIIQLQQCLIRNRPLPDGKEKCADKVILAVQGRLHVRLRDEIKDHTKQGIIILESPRIAELLRTHCFEIYKKINTTVSSITNNPNLIFGNQSLKKALRSNNLKNITDYSCDLEFFIGGRKKPLFIIEDYKKFLAPLNAKEKEILWLISACKKTESFAQNPLIIGDIASINCKFQEELLKYESESNKNLKHDIQNKKEALHKLEVHIQRITKSTLREHESKIIEEILNLIYSGEQSKIDGDIKKKIEESFFSTNYLKEHLKLSRSISLKESSLLEEPSVEINFSENFISEVNRVSTQYKHNLNVIENEDSSTEIVQELLDAASFLLNFQTVFFDNASPLTKRVTNDHIKKYNSRISFSPSILFDSTRDLALLGGAGYGKTTTLQSYALKCQSNGRRDCIYIELTRYRDILKKYIPDTKGIAIKRYAFLDFILESHSIKPNRESRDELKAILDSGFWMHPN
ncbi:MAG: hypothetical protein ABJK37_10375 [Paraglaciecola sp.]|uniref:hypothetical protein n=1 Tax=Paraglaciecola sp. TaxID=1920173 RepID=UPI0032992B27